MRFSGLAVLVALIVSCRPPVTPDLIGGVKPLAAGEGWTVYVPPFDVPPGVEIQDCYFFAFPDLHGDGSEVWIDRFTMAGRTGSHHMNIFRVNTILKLDGRDGDVVHGGECRISPNWADWPLVVNSQESTPEKPVVDWVLPDGVAQKFTPGEMLMVQTHYVNADLQLTPNGGEVIVNFHLADDVDPIEMGTLFATQQSIRICESNPQPVFSGACGFAGADGVNAFHVAAANGHFHSRGSTFRLYAWDGVSIDHPPDDAEFYESTSWDEPPMAIDLDVQVPAQGGIWWDCEYRWQPPESGCDEVNARDPEQAGDCCYTFGGEVTFGEHCNVFVYYWPKTEDVFCN